MKVHLPIHFDQPHSAANSATTVAIVIPYYQIEPGILERALRSVLAQELSQQVVWHVVVIDDASPCPAREEVARLPIALQVAVTAYSGVIRPVIPKVSGHPFRFYPATDSGASGHPVM